MSSDIIYHSVAARLPKERTGQAEDLFVWAWQIGASNCYDHFGRRSRNWALASLGTREQVMRTAIYMAGDCAGGMLKLGSANGWATPETLIAKMRRKLQKAANSVEPPMFRGHQLAVRLVQRGQDGTVLREFSLDEIGSFLDAHPGFLAERVIVGWRYASVQGPDLR